MGFKIECVVIKFHDGEKYAAQICSGEKEECFRRAAYFRGLYHDVKEVKFGVYPVGVIDKLCEMEAQGKETLYELLNKL